MQESEEEAKKLEGPPSSGLSQTNSGTLIQALAAVYAALKESSRAVPLSEIIEAARRQARPQ